jgi:putative flippase GtrA
MARGRPLFPLLRRQFPPRFRRKFLPRIRLDAETVRQVLNFIWISVLALGLDYVVYTALLPLGVHAAQAKAIGFLAGGVWTFLGNRLLNFKRKAGASGFAIFWALYLTSLGVNVAINSLGLAILPDEQGMVSAAFIAAAFASAVLNFFGMKLIVFRDASSESAAQPTAAADAGP